MEERLQKYISQSGVASRREAERMIAEGFVFVNGKQVTEMGYKVTEKDEVKIGEDIIKPQENKVYYMLNKPTGYITTTKDDRDRKTVMNLVRVKERVYPVGRLDYDSSGLLLFTNDGDFKNLLINPVNEVEKEYHVKIEGLLRKEESRKIEKGIELDGVKTRPARIINVKYDDTKTSTYLDIIIKEGKNREIRRLFDSVNHKVKSLKRTRIGNLKLDIDTGYFRSLTPHEVKLLKLLALGNIKK